MRETHNRSTPEHRLVWYVDRLVDLAADLEVKTVPLSDIFEFDEVYWFDDHYPEPDEMVPHES